GLAHAADRVELGERLVGRLGVHRRLDDAGGDGVDAHAAAGELDGERTRHRVERALRQRGERGWHSGDRLVDESGRDRDDGARTSSAPSPWDAPVMMATLRSMLMI